MKPRPVLEAPRILALFIVRHDDTGQIARKVSFYNFNTTEGDVKRSFG